MPKPKYKEMDIFPPHQAMLSVSADAVLSDERITTEWGTFYLLWVT
ncbi:MAG: hypothetical protein QXJ27_03360 [Thermoplasmata archaeon]